jgi:dipeptidyl aminopeptidase/acylaminoacyl peptidase
MRVAAVVASALLFFFPGLALAADTHPFDVHDLVGMDRISEPAVSPDGKSVVFTVSSVDLDANRRTTDLWIVGSDGKGLRRLTSHPAADTSAAWAPDGKSIWFLSARSGSMQIWKIPADMGEAQQVTNLPLDVGGFVLSRDGSKVAFHMDVFPDCGTIECTSDRSAEKKKSTGRVYDQLMVRHWDTWADGKRSHVFVMATSGEGKPVDVMKSMAADCPSKPFGGTEEYTFTPDGGSIVLTAKDVGRSEAWSTNHDLFVAPVDGKTAPKRLTDNPATDTGPVFSPDGRTLAYRAMRRAGFEADRFRIVLRSWPDGKERTVADDWDRSPDSLSFSRDGSTLYVIADDLGRHPLFAVPAGGGKVRAVVADGHVAAAVTSGDVLVYALDHFRSPDDLYTIRPDGTKSARITELNAARLAAARMGESEQFSFKGAGDDTVYAWVVKPVDFDPGKKYPVALLIHGGPQGSFGSDFHYRWNPQVYAGAGYAVVMVDFHGSTGYGQAFTDAIRGDWGGKPLVDLQRGLAAALARYSWMDGDRVCALGASYGGYMINWILGNWPDRFRCLVSHDGNLDETAAYYDTEELWFPEWEHGGVPWESPEGFAKHSPVNFVKNWRTPTLVVHGALDFRVVETAGLSTFTALQRKGIPSKLLYFPDENHWVLKPQNSILWHETVIAWIDKWTKGDPGAAVPASPAR